MLAVPAEVVDDPEPDSRLVVPASNDDVAHAAGDAANVTTEDVAVATTAVTANDRRRSLGKRRTESPLEEMPAPMSSTPGYNLMQWSRPDPNVAGKSSDSHRPANVLTDSSNAYCGTESLVLLAPAIPPVSGHAPRRCRIGPSEGRPTVTRPVPTVRFRSGPRPMCRHCTYAGARQSRPWRRRPARHHPVAAKHSSDRGRSHAREEVGAMNRLPHPVAWNAHGHHADAAHRSALGRRSGLHVALPTRAR